MALDKVYYIANQTKIPAKNLNEIQDEIIKNSNNIEKIKNVLDDVNTMTFKGLLGSDAISDLPTYTDENPIKQGDTYVVKDGGPYNGKNVKPGDMFIATVSGKDVIWNLVPSANDGNVYANAGLGENKVILGDTGTNNIKALNNGTQGQVLTINNDGIPAFSDVAVKDGSVTTDKIADNAITSSKIADKSITEEKLDDNLKTTINGKEIITNKVTSLSDDATDDQYPTAKAVNNALKSSNANINNQFNNALKGYAVGEGALRIDDSSPIEHEMNVRVSSKNLIDLSLIPTTETIRNGITYKYLPDEQCVVLNGTATTSGSIFSDIEQHYSQIFEDVEYVSSIKILSGTFSFTFVTSFRAVDGLVPEFSIATATSQTTGNSKTVKSPKGFAVHDFYLWIEKGLSFDNCKIQVQLERGTTATDYTPYVDVSTVALTQRGKNLIPYERRNLSNCGVNFTVNDDGSLTANGTATAPLSQYFHAVGTAYNVPNGKVYTLSDPTTDSETTYQTRGQTLKPDGSDGFTFLCTKAKPYYTWSDEQAATVRAGVFIKTQVSPGTTVSNLKFYPQFELGNAATKYEAPLPEITYSVPEDGIVTGIKNIYPTTTLLANKDNVVIDVEYNRDINNPDVFKDFVKFTDYASSNKSGVIKFDPWYGLNMFSSGMLYVNNANTKQIADRDNAYKPIVPTTINFAVKAALSDAKRISDMTDEEKANARGVIGAAAQTELEKKANSDSVYTKEESDQNFANALKGKAIGNNAIRIDDSSPIEHEMNVRVSSKNLIDLSVSGESTVAGVTVKYLPDEQCLVLNGTVSSSASILSSTPQHRNILKKGTYIQSVKIIGGTSSSTFYTTIRAGEGLDFTSVGIGGEYLSGTHIFTLENDTLVSNMYIWLVKGVVFDNCKIQVQLERGTTATDYAPYVDSTSVTLSEYGKNLIPYPYANTTKTVNGITFTDNGDGSITINGTATDNTSFSLSEKLPINLSSVYTLSKNVANIYLYIGYYKNNSYVGEKAVSGSLSSVLVDLTTIDCDRARCAFQIIKGTTINKAILKPQLELGSTNTVYEKYVPRKTFTPSADGTVTGVNNIYPTTSLLSNKDNVIIDVEYNKDLNKSLNFAPLDESGKIPDGYLHGATVKQYGVRWKGTSSTVCERLGDAVSLTAKAHKGSTESVDNDFDNIYPWSDIKTCNIDADGNVLAYLGEPSFARDGTNGDVMVEIPKFYYKRVKTGIVEEIWICGTKLPGYELHPLFIDNGKEASKVFHSVYNASSFTDETDNKVKLQSITGVQPRVRTTRANFRTYARNKGAIWGIEDISCVNALQLLYLVEYANTNSQAVLGSGADGLSYTQNHKALEETANGNSISIASTFKNVYKLGQRIEIGSSYGYNNRTAEPRTITAITTDDTAGKTVITFDGNPITISVGDMVWNVAPLNGSCDALNGESGWLSGDNSYTDHYADINYRGVEGFHAKLFRFIDGVNIKDNLVYYANSMADYADGIYSGKYRAVGYTNGASNGYISAFGYDEKASWIMFPTAAGGGSATYVPDYYYQQNGERLLLFGGAFLYGSNAGAFCFSCYNAFSYSYVYCGAHLLCKKP